MHSIILELLSFSTTYYQPDKEIPLPQLKKEKQKLLYFAKITEPFTFLAFKSFIESRII